MGSLHGCTWKCNPTPNNEGVCIGGYMCSGEHDASSCETSIFGCHWAPRCDGYCSGSNMCSGSGQSECSNSIFGCTWTCNCLAEGEVCGGPGQQTRTCCGDAMCRPLYGGTQMRCITVVPALRGSKGASNP